MLLVLCSIDDAVALRFSVRARERGVVARVLTGEALSFATRRSQRLLDRDGVSTFIEQLNQSTIDDHAISGVLNRLVEPPSAAWRFAASAERDYAAAEMYAFVVSWLTALDCPVRNRPSPGCLAGPALGALPLAAAARKVGLDCPDVRLGTESACTDGPADVVLAAAALAAVGPRARPIQVGMCDGVAMTAGLPDGIAQACARLTSEIGASQAVMGLNFLCDGSRWMLAGVTPLPVLDGAVGDKLLTVLADRGARRIDAPRQSVA